MPWDRVRLALTLLMVDPCRLGGLWLRARASPLRDRVTGALAPMSPRKIHTAIDDTALFGGLDLAGTLAAGRPVHTRGLLADGGVVLLSMAERCPAGLAARLGQALDCIPSEGRARTCLIAVDEGAGSEEGLPQALADRLGLFLSLDGLAWADTAPLAVPEAALAAARARLALLPHDPSALDRLVESAAQLGIDSARAPLLALNCARAAAAWRGHPQITPEDLVAAAELVYAHRATALPPSEDEAQPTPPRPDPATGSEPETEQDQPDALPDETLVEAARAALPPDLMARLAGLRGAKAMRAQGSGAGSANNSFVRGRPLPARRGTPGSGQRIDLVATLRAAAPWQVLRQSMRRGDRLVILPGDMRIRRHEERSTRVLIFAVDTSGSQAMTRMAEAKGAIELLLAEAYARRDHVALVTFRGDTADLTLPPTRSLVQAKRRLAGLPGGGGTPLAAGLQTALSAAQQARSKGMTPVIAVLTDGRANISLDRRPGREAAAADATRIARAIAASGVGSIVIDTGVRPQPALDALARAMGSECLALPRARAPQLSAALGALMGA
ncbi:magnesium chelatase subunit D [Pararhodobacter sp. SW119]|uniref:magnesium chelatase subunit D n=1 Tax=Pararhodobacter sp. SW119 TaxID=2780075 RepID=UPI001FD780AA|nr:magnesium chelatase subunit D [Pararhodobacter sp. SW119]